MATTFRSEWTRVRRRSTAAWCASKSLAVRIWHSKSSAEFDKWVRDHMGQIGEKSQSEEDSGAVGSRTSTTEESTKESELTVDESTVAANES